MFRVAAHASNIESFCLRHLRHCVSSSVLMAIVVCSLVRLRVFPNKSSAFLGFYPEGSKGLVQISLYKDWRRANPLTFSSTLMHFRMLNEYSAYHPGAPAPAPDYAISRLHKEGAFDDAATVSRIALEVAPLSHSHWHWPDPSKWRLPAPW
jgi:hypothetical protein